MAMMYVTTYTVFFLTGAFLGTVLCSFFLKPKLALILGSPVGLATIWLYHSGLTEEKLDGTFVWWGFNLDASGLMAAYFGPALILGLIFYARFRTFFMNSSEPDHSS